MSIFKFFKKKNKVESEELKTHKVPVYDNGDKSKIIEWTDEPLHVTHLTRYKHELEDYTTYSFNTHYEDGMIYMGFVPDKPFGYQQLEKNDGS